MISAPELQPELITRLLGMEPDRSRPPGPDGPGEWQLNSKLGAGESIAEHILHLLGILMPLRHKLREFRHDANLEFYCAIQKQDEAPIIEIPPRLQLLCGHIGSMLRIEIEEDETSTEPAGKTEA